MVLHTADPGGTAPRPRVTLVTGERGAGKSTLCSAISVRARADRRTTCGIISIAVYDVRANKVGIDAIELTSQRRFPLARRDGTLVGSTWSCYSFSDDAFAECVSSTVESLDGGADLLILDEIGPLELSAQKGFLPILRHLESARLPRETFLVVRPTLLEEMRRFFDGCADRPAVNTVEITPDTRRHVALELGVEPR